MKLLDWIIFEIKWKIGEILNLFNFYHLICFSFKSKMGKRKDYEFFSAFANFAGNRRAGK